MINILNKLYVLVHIQKFIARKPIITYNFPMLYSTGFPKDDTDIPKYDMENPFEKEREKCILCAMNVTPNYKNIKLLSQFQSPFTGRIYGKHITGLCTHKQKQVELEIQKAQCAGLMGYYNKNVKFMKDPKLFNPETPIRTHRF